METTKVIYRKFKDTGDIIAFFPEIAATRDGYNCQSYMHIGQHSGADPFIVSVTTPATFAEYESLERELQEIGYTLKTVRRFTYAMQQIRQAQFN